MYKKIDLYRVHRNERGRIVRTEYLCSTNRSKTCREAVARFHEINAMEEKAGTHRAPLNAEIKAQFA